MPDILVTLPGGEELAGHRPIVIVGPNGSGKTRLSRTIADRTTQVEFVNALRSTRISPQLPAMSQLAARQQHEGTRNTARNQPWELASDFDFILAQLLAEDGDSARTYRSIDKAGEDPSSIPPTALEQAEKLWGLVFPGRELDWKDWAPVVTNEFPNAITYTASQMSDGERAALYLLAKVLLTPTGTVMVIDEPETHFHSQLAVRFWDALQRTRDDLRFVYVTHDLTFGLSREPADFLLADPTDGLVHIEVDHGLPPELRREILGAASFSYYASRVVFCEGADQSFDKTFLSAWCHERDTVVVAAGSRDAVRQCVQSFNTSALVANLEAVGVVDRDFMSDEAVQKLGSGVTVLPVHEIEALICLPQVVSRLAEHLAVQLTKKPEQLIKDSVSNEAVLRVAHERTKLRFLNGVEDSVCAKPQQWDEASLRSCLAAVGISAQAADVESIFDEELALARKARESGDATAILAIFPSKEIAAVIASQLHTKVPALFELVSHSLSVAGTDDSLSQLGNDLEKIFGKIGLPQRTVGERTVGNRGQD